MNVKLALLWGEHQVLQFFPSPPSQLPAKGIFLTAVGKNMIANRVPDRTGMYLRSGHSM